MAAGAPPALPTALFDYPLPPDRIAQEPLAERDASRLLHLPPAPAPPEDRHFRDLPGLLRRGDLLVVNDTRVRAARLLGTRQGGGRAEILVLGPAEERDTFACLVRPGRRLPAGARIAVADGLQAIVEGPAPGHPGARTVRFVAPGDVATAIEAAGSAPLPPYIRRPPAGLRDRYQTVFAASPPESAAAPTAGLHFTAGVLDSLARAGVETAAVRLEVGLGTFAPIRAAEVEGHRMHEERYRLPVATATAVERTRVRAGRVVAVGTTVVRVLESRALPGGLVSAGEGSTGLFLHPGAPPQVIDGLLTNFHQPRSSLLVLLAAVVGLKRWRIAYDHALASGYRFLSFGDCMLCWREARP